jgi:hypothetical protein
MGQSQWQRGLRHEPYRPLEQWDREFEPHSRHGYLSVYILCVGNGLATG